MTQDERSEGRNRGHPDGDDHEPLRTFTTDPADGQPVDEREDQRQDLGRGLFRAVDRAVVPTAIRRRAQA